MSAAVGAALKKIAVAIISNPKVLKTIFGIVLGIIIIIIMPIIAILGIFSGNIEINTDELHQQIVAEVNSQYESVLTAIEIELVAQGIEIDPTKAQVIYLYALPDREKDNPNFYADFAACFKDAENDDAIFTNITEKFGVTFTDVDKQKILAMVLPNVTLIRINREDITTVFEVKDKSILIKEDLTKTLNTITNDTPL